MTIRAAGGPVSRLAVTAIAAVTVVLAGCGTPAPAAAGRAPTGHGCDARAAAVPGGQAELNDVQFVSASTGWVVGSDRILHTGNGGATWTVQYRSSNSAQLSTVDFADAAHGWVVGSSAILATADGGAHWHVLPEPCQPIRSVHFISPADGLAVAGGRAPYLGIPMVGGILLRTTDGGRHWRRAIAPAGVQTVCMSDRDRGWLGASGNIYGTVNGGRSWTLAVRGPIERGGLPDLKALAAVRCAAAGAGWAELIGPGAAMNKQPHTGYHTYGSSWRPIFAQQFFPHQGVPVRASAPGAYPGPFSAISGSQAVFIDSCAPCTPAGRQPPGRIFQGTAPMDIATSGGAVLLRRPAVSQLGQANGAAFETVNDGWVVGIQSSYPAAGNGRAMTVSRIMHTSDGGRTWQVQYAGPG